VACLEPPGRPIVLWCNPRLPHRTIVPRDVNADDALASIEQPPLHGLGRNWEQAMPGSERGTVVIVEDDLSMCQAMKRILLLGGFEPRMYGSAEALLDDDRKDAVCMILDVQLPGMSGFALRERLGAHGALPPVIFITAFDEDDARVHAERLGAAGFLAKPFAGRLLLETIRRAIVSRTMLDAAREP
jgi:CheY-like chemotaxis protein